MSSSLSEPSAGLLPNSPSLLTSSATHEDLMQLADELKGSPFAMPLSLLLTSHLPLRGLAVAAIDMFRPLLSFVLSDRARRMLAYAAEKPEEWQAFLDRLSDRSDT